MAEFFTNIIQNLRKYFEMASVMDLLDIVIVAVIIYSLIQLMRRTNAMRVLQGIALLLLAMWTADLVNLHTMSFILSNTIQVGMLAAIIIFQPELRKALEQLGSRKLTSILARETPGVWDSAIFQTVEACKALSWERTGALIVFEKTVLLNDIIKTGTLISANISAELLKNIFYPKAPLHDGAVIVRSALLASAGCMLPLTNNQQISRELGMRHRAALGMSESSDAICVVVSEETGSISVAQGGMLKRHLSHEALEKILSSQLMPPSDDEKPKGLQRITRLWRSDGHGKQ